jgi:hypothetical protein
MMWTSSALFAMCELGAAIRLSRHAENPVLYVVPLLLLFPMAFGWLAFRRVSNWEGRSELSAEVAARVDSVTSVLVLFVYILFLLASDLK